MPQTRFVTRKAFAMGFQPIVVINKVDRNGARPDWVLDRTFDLFDRLGATDAQLDFPIIYCSALEGFATMDLTKPAKDMTALFDIIVSRVRPPQVDPNGPFQMQVSALDYNSYTGLIGIGRVTRGHLRANSPVIVASPDGNTRPARLQQIFGFLGLVRVETQEAYAGEIIAFTGIDKLGISDTLCHPDKVELLPSLTVDHPTISMTFQVNNSPLAGREGKFVTSRQLRSRLFRELEHNVALGVEETSDPDKFRVSGRGELHLGILIENMRREGFELGVSRPEVIIREENGKKQEPYEQLTVDVEEQHQGTVMETLGQRKGALTDMAPDGKGRIRLDYLIPARGLIGFQTEFRTITSGSGVLHHVFDKYGPLAPSTMGQRKNGVLIAIDAGRASAYSLWNLQERGRHFIDPGTEVYEGMIIGIHTRGNDLVVNPLKGKQLTNVRASGTDDNIILTPPVRLSLEQALEFIDDDELVEVTPKTIRMRKKLLKEHERRKSNRAKKG